MAPGPHSGLLTVLLPVLEPEEGQVLGHELENLAKPFVLLGLGAGIRVDTASRPVVRRSSAHRLVPPRRPQCLAASHQPPGHDRRRI
jgi:hypothetical protein